MDAHITMQRHGVETDLTELFARVPDDVVIAAAGHDTEMGNPFACLVGWVVREHIARLTDTPILRPDDVALTREEMMQVRDPVDTAVKAFGGRPDDWANVFYGVCHKMTWLPPIETAWTLRLLQAVNGGH